MPQPPFDEAVAHRWFAVECNNAAWAIVENPARSPEQVETMLHLAHAACLHWSRLGTSLNRQRALDLLARAHAITGQTDLAVQYAEQALTLSDQHGAEQTPFDRAESLGCMAFVLRRAGRSDEAEGWRQKTLPALDRLSEGERSVVVRLMDLN